MHLVWLKIETFTKFGNFLEVIYGKFTSLTGREAVDLQPRLDDVQRAHKRRRHSTCNNFYNQFRENPTKIPSDFQCVRAQMNEIETLEIGKSEKLTSGGAGNGVADAISDSMAVGGIGGPATHDEMKSSLFSISRAG